MYSNNFAAAIKVGGKILREFGDTVYLPFGSEYAIRLKNLGSTRAKVKIEIDGRCVTGFGLVLRAGETSDLERFISNGDLSGGNRFKFIERTSTIESHRGIEVDDGIISISYQFEIPEVTVIPSIYYNPSLETKTRGYWPQTSVYSATSGSLSHQVNQGVVLDSNWSSVTAANQTGITAEGSISNQSFDTTWWRGSIDVARTLNIRLLGETEDNRHVREPITVKTKPQCKYCGTKSPATAKFCPECGAALNPIS